MRWDFLAPHLTVPYVPTLGPVHPSCLGPALLEEVLSVAHAQQRLRYDPQARWGLPKREVLLAREIEQDERGTVIPVARDGRRIFYSSPRSCICFMTTAGTRCSPEKAAPA